MASVSAHEPFGPPLPVELYRATTPAYIVVLQRRRWERVHPGQYVPVPDEVVIWFGNDYHTIDDLRETRDSIQAALDAIEKARHA
jgi:hypothetical protein